MFSLICTWTNGCANNRDAGYLKHQSAHCDVTVMFYCGMVFDLFHPYSSGWFHWSERNRIAPMLQWCCYINQANQWNNHSKMIIKMHNKTLSISFGMDKIFYMYFKTMRFVYKLSAASVREFITISSIPWHGGIPANVATSGHLASLDNNQ